jgi:rhodanese-related sulfurtransferase
MDHSPGFLAHVDARRATVTEVTVPATQAALEATPSARLIDVREDTEFTAAHASGAVHIGRGVLERDIERLVPDKDTPLYLYCGGGFRSALAADSLQQMGYRAVHSVAGGWRAWQEAGAPVTGGAPAEVNLSYPIGRVKRKPAYTAEERAVSIARLAHQPTALAAALSGLSEADLDRPYRPDGWTVRQVVHHLADSHMNMFIRLKLAVTEEEPTIRPYAQDPWVRTADAAEVSPMASVQLLSALHTRIVALFRSLTPEQFARVMHHPENGPMSLDLVLAVYAWHGDHHVAHITGLRQREGI